MNETPTENDLRWDFKLLTERLRETVKRKADEAGWQPPPDPNETKHLCGKTR